MTVSASDIYQLAEDLARAGAVKGCEASRRSSASRAYYAALHATIGVLPHDLAPTGAEVKGKDSHSIIGDAVTKWAVQVRNGRSEARILARKLPKLKHVRKCADYKIMEDFTEEQTNFALKEAAEILKTVAEAERKLALPAA